MPNKIGDSPSNQEAFRVRQPEEGRQKPSPKKTKQKDRKLHNIIGNPQVDSNALIELRPVLAKKVKVSRDGGGSAANKVKQVAKVIKDEDIADLSKSMADLKMTSDNVAAKGNSAKPLQSATPELMDIRDDLSKLQQPKSAIPLQSATPQSMDIRENSSKPSPSESPKPHSSAKPEPMDTSDDLNSLANDLMDLEEDKVPKSRQIQRMIDDLAGFDPSKLQENDVVMAERSSDQASMDWISTWKDFPQIVAVLTRIESRFQFVEIPDYEMTDADIDMVPVDEAVPDEEMPSADEEMPPARQPPPPVGGNVENRFSPPVIPPVVIHPPRDLARDLGGAPPVAAPPPASAHLNFVPVVTPLARRQQVAAQRPVFAPISQIGFSHAQGVHQAKQYMHAKRFDAAILLLSKIYIGSAHKMEVLELMADCFYQTNRTATALELFQKVAHQDKKNLRVKEKIADCLTKQYQYLKANLIYTAISKKLGVAHANLLKVKIDKNNELLKTLQIWPTFGELMNKIGIDNGQKMTPAQLTAITAFQRANNPRAYLMWEIEMNKVKRATIETMEADPSVKKFPIYLDDGSVLTDATGKTIHLYKAADLSLLTHFTKPSLATKILDTEHVNNQRPPGETDPHSFWNNQYKVCCSMVKQGSQSFFSVNNAAAIGFAAYVPDPLSNIIHTWSDDCYTPTYFSAPGVRAVTGQSGAEKAQKYNEFMARFQPLTSYVYSVFQQADRLQQQLEVRNQFLELQKDISSRLTRIKLPIIDALFNKLTSFFPKLDPGKQRLESIISEIEEAIRTSDLGSSEIQENIIQKLNSIKDLLQDEGESLRSKAVGKRIKTLFDGLTKAVPIREGGAATRPSLYKNPQLKKPLISLYLKETKKLVTDLLSSGMNEEELFTTLFRRPPRVGESIAEALSEIGRSLANLYEDNKTILYKAQALTHNFIWTRTLSPKELVDSVKSGHYSEIGVRGHGASDEVNANHVKFAGIVLEEGMTIRPSGDGTGYVIDPVNGSATFLSEHVAPKTISDAIKKAHAEKLPCFVIGS